MTHLTINEKSRLQADRELLIAANQWADTLLTLSSGMCDQQYVQAVTRLMMTAVTARYYREAITDCGLVISLRCLEQELLEKVKSLSQLKGQDTAASCIALGLRVLRKCQSLEHCHTRPVPSFYPTPASLIKIGDKNGQC